jgi:hypothetical protein
MVPARLAAGEQAFLTAVVAGDNLRPYQNTRLAKADFDDGLLNDFGIQHFHLGTAPHPAKWIPNCFAGADRTEISKSRGE